MADTYRPAFELPGLINPAARRIEIDEFIPDHAMTNLFLLALREMQDQPLKALSDMKEDDWFNYYNLAGMCTC